MAELLNLDVDDAGNPQVRVMEVGGMSDKQLDDLHVMLPLLITRLHHLRLHVLGEREARRHQQHRFDDYVPEADAGKV
jgi:hypothetical protein